MFFHYNLTVFQLTSWWPKTIVFVCSIWAFEIHVKSLVQPLLHLYLLEATRTLLFHVHTRCQKSKLNSVVLSYEFYRWIVNCDFNLVSLSLLWHGNDGWNDINLCTVNVMAEASLSNFQWTIRRAKRSNVEHVLNVEAGKRPNAAVLNSKPS